MVREDAVGTCLVLFVCGDIIDNSKHGYSHRLISTLEALQLGDCSVKNIATRFHHH